MKIEKYFGCDGGCLRHISYMLYFFPKKDDYEEDDVINFTVKIEYLYQRIIPPFSFNPMDWPYDLGNYFRGHILRRIPVALAYIFQKYYTKKEGILDCFDFKEKDIPEIKEFLSNLSSLETFASKRSSVTIDNEKWHIRFNISQLDKDIPWRLGWEIQFRPRNVWGRIGYALKYVFGSFSDEQHFDINKSDAEHLNGLIAVVEELNKDE